MFTIEIDASDFTGDIEAVIKGIVDGKLMQAIGDMWTGSYIDEVFESEGAITGQSWAPTGRGESILRDTSKMRDSFISTVKGSELVISNTQTKYFPTHELGAGRYGPVRIVAKNAPYLMFQRRGVGSTPTSAASPGAMRDADKRAKKAGRKDSSPTGQWVRVKEVHIPKRSMLRVGDELTTRIGNETVVWLNENWGKR